MQVVAITELNGELETEAAPIAALLGVSAYDVKSRLAGALPRLLLQTADREVAERTRAALAARGHGVLTLDASTLIASAQMVKLHRFVLDTQGVWANDGVGARLAWGDLAVVVVALVRADVSRVIEDVVHHLDRHTSKVQHEKTEHTFTHVAYLFPRSGAPSPTPWLLDEAVASFWHLGAMMQATRRQNFLATLARVRDLAPHAIVDDRFMAHPLTSTALLQGQGSYGAPPVVTGTTVDLTVHVLAEWLRRDRSGPYR